MPDSRKKQRNLCELKYGQKIDELKTGINKFELERKILEVELKLAQMKI